MNLPSHRVLLALPLAAALASASATADAQPRLSGRLELGASLLVTSPQSNDFGLGFAGRADVGVRLAGPLHLRAYGAYLRWPASSASTQIGNTASAASTIFGGGLSVEPALARRIRLRVEGDIGVSLNGARTDARLTWGGGLGAWFGVGDTVDLGPIVRVGSIQAAASEAPTQGGPGAAYFLQFGLALAFHAADAPPAPEPEPQPVVYAPPPRPVVVAPVAQAPLVTFAAPATSPSAVVVVPQPTAAPAFVPGAPIAVAPYVEEPRGRHHRRHREGGRRGGRRGGGGHHRRRH
jgi:hypothetical protein